MNRFNFSSSDVQSGAGGTPSNSGTPSGKQVRFAGASKGFGSGRSGADDYGVALTPTPMNTESSPAQLETLNVLSKMLDFMRNEAEGREDEREQDIAIALHSIKVDMEGKRLDAHASAGIMSMLLGGFTFTVFLEGPQPVDFEEKTSIWVGYVYITTMTLVFVLNLFSAVISSVHYSFGSRLLAYRYGMLNGVGAFRKLLRSDLADNRKDNEGFALSLPPMGEARRDLEAGGIGGKSALGTGSQLTRRCCCARDAAEAVRSPRGEKIDAVAAMPYDFHRFHNSTLCVRRAASTAFQASIPLFMLGMALQMFNMMGLGAAIVQSCVIFASLLTTIVSMTILVRKYVQELPGGRGEGAERKSRAEGGSGSADSPRRTAPTPTHNVSTHQSPKVHPLLANVMSSSAMKGSIQKASRRISRSFSSNAAALDLPNFEGSDGGEAGNAGGNPRRRRRGSKSGSRAELPGHLRKFSSQRQMDVKSSSGSSSSASVTTLESVTEFKGATPKARSLSVSPGMLRREQSMPSLGGGGGGGGFGASLQIDCSPLNA